MKTFAIVLSAGNSTRFGGETKKQFFELHNKPVLFYSINAFNKSKHIDEIIVVTNKNDIEYVKELIFKYNFTKVKTIVAGGEYRQESVKNGLDQIKEDGYVLIHDSARPLVDDEIIQDLINALKDYDGAVPALNVVDTIVRSENGQLNSFENRENLFLIQTPQAFRLSVIKEAHKKFVGLNATDDSRLLVQMNKKVKLIKGKEKLRKITRLEDTNAIKAYIEKDEYLQN